MDDATVEPTVMPLDLLREITNGFSEERELGSGSFGKVYLGVYPDGEKVAVKKLYDMPGLDDKQFRNEFNNLRRLQHQNIVRLVGYCRDIQHVHVMYEGKLVLAEKAHRALCLEYISNGSLDKYLSEGCDGYNWHTCYRIIKGICQGLKYLHNELKPPIYHLDLKPANILLDENMVPRIADFGISRLFGDEHTGVTKSLLGTLGYSPPEFIRSNLISNKFDIFSFGVVIIKMMAGRAGYSKSTEMSSHEFTNLVQENWTSRLLETSNRRNAYSEQIKMCIEIGLNCVQEDRRGRPTIQDIVYRLEETETKCTYAARKDWSLIFQPVPKIDKNLAERKVKNWKISAHEKFDEQENSGGLAPDYFMSNDDLPVRAKPLNNEAGPSVQARPTWQYPNDMAAQQDFSEQRPFRQQNGFSSAELMSNTDAGPSKQAPLFSLHTVHQGLGQHGPSIPQDGTLCCHLNQGNILNGQGSLPAQPTAPSYNFLPVPEDGASLIDQQNEYLSSSTTDAPGTSCPVTDGVGVSQGTSSFNHVEDDIYSVFVEELLREEGSFVSAPLPISDNQFHGYEHDDGDWW